MKTPTPSILTISYAHPAQKPAAQAFAEAHELPYQPLHKTRSDLSLNFTEMQLDPSC